MTSSGPNLNPSMLIHNSWAHELQDLRFSEQIKHPLIELENEVLSVPPWTTLSHQNSSSQYLDFKAFAKRSMDCLKLNTRHTRPELTLAMRAPIHAWASPSLHKQPRKSTVMDQLMGCPLGRSTRDGVRTGLPLAHKPPACDTKGKWATARRVSKNRAQNRWRVSDSIYPFFSLPPLLNYQFIYLEQSCVF